MGSKFNYFVMNFLVHLNESFIFDINQKDLCAPQFFKTCDSFCSVLPLKGSLLWNLTMEESWHVMPTMKPLPSLWWPRWPWMCIVSVPSYFLKAYTRAATGTLRSQGILRETQGAFCLVHSACAIGPRRIQHEGKITPV